MTALHGIVTQAGAAVRAGDEVYRLPKTRTPLGEAVAALVVAIDAGELLPCPNCGRYACECWEWVELMTAPLPADPHEDLSEGEIPF